MITVYLKGGLEQKQGHARARPASSPLAESLGGGREPHRAPRPIMTHASVPAEPPQGPWASPTTSSALSVGIEDADDLIEDLDQALR
ncbi:MAG: hypothetical protein KatS3mg103_1258 [Phycisphaerales bacterium]|nr:MAG: hypothetical protein KatS3mg103_1258 [Phycisphaerales bacterium]